MPASLFVVATPIGNLEDITLRALKVLKAVPLIAAEDTRRTGTLLRHFGINTPTTSFHEHNEREKLPQLLQRLADGQDLALVSDAGTPVVADPGQRLISAAIERGIAIVPIPGASAVTAAIAISGFPADSFVFLGFAPNRSNDRTKWLESLNKELRPAVFFEAPHRIRKMLVAMSSVLGNRPIILCRELTKVHEEIVRFSAHSAATLNIVEKGEFTIVVGPTTAHEVEPQTIEDKDIYLFFCDLTNNKGFLRRAALTRTALYFGLSTKTVYAVIERFKHSCLS